MRILYIDQYFSTREGNSGTRSYEFARRFVLMGHQVTVLTTASDYSNLAGQKKAILRQRIEGIDVISFRIGYAQRMGYLRRAFSFARFMLASIAAGMMLGGRDVVFASSTPLSVGVTGALIAWRHGVPFVFEVRDLWPRAPIELGVIRHPALIWFLTATEKWIYRRAARINALSPGMAEGIVSRGIAPEKVLMIPNACDMDLATEKMEREELRKRFDIAADAFLVVYAGTLGRTNGLEALLDVAAEIRKRGRSDIAFALVGTGSESERLKRYAADLSLRNIIFAGGMTRREAASFIAAADLGVTCFADLPVLRTNSPNKLFDYLAAGLPQMVNAAGWMSEIVESAGAGFYWPSADPGLAAEKIIALAGDRVAHSRMKEAASRTARERFERGLLTARMIEMLQEASGEAPGGLPIAWQGFFDRTVALLGLLILSPALAAIAWAVKNEDRGPVFYKPTRIGLAQKPFPMFKFRTMVTGAEKTGLGLNVENGDPRITRTGRFLREWSLDELPQLFNVLLGQMRLVGPRPALPDHLAKYREKHLARFHVRPGLTGWAQVNGRNDLSWEEKLEYDLWYVANRSFYTDMRILFRTLRVVLKREGLYERDAGTDDPFNRFPPE
jgi:lipopolysaccharide/colanic/teichoic acid biosynthesis glycosyltransferase/glycosyltransferase involved in cell wall biosynthesis